MIKIESISHGWINVKFCGITLKASYLLDAPVEWLRSIHFSLQNGLPLCLTFFDEETYNVLVSNHVETFFYKSDKVFIKDEDLHYINCAMMLFTDLLKFKQECVMWLPRSDEYTEDDVKTRTELLNHLFDSINSFFLLRRLKKENE